MEEVLMGIPYWAKAGAGWVIVHPAETAVLIYAGYHAPVPTLRILALLGTEYGPATARVGLGVSRIVGSSFPRFVGFASRVGAVGAGLLIGAAAGVIISGIIWGDEGAEDARDFYMGRVSWDEYSSTVYAGIQGL
jgi:hypothetical protein